MKTARPYHVARVIVRLLRAALEIYGVFVILYGLARILTSDAIRLVDLIDYSMPALLIPALGALPLMLLLRQWRTVVLLVPAVLVFFVNYGSLFIARAEPERQPDLVIMTYNIRQSNSHGALLSQSILSSGADIVLMQETNARVDRVLRPLIEADYPYISIHAASPTRLGLGVVSKYPLIDEDYEIYSDESSRQRFQVEVDGKLVTIFNVHLANPLVSGDAGLLQTYSQHQQGIDGLVDLLTDESAPLIVAGDFNMTDFSPSYRRMTQNLLDSFRESGSGLGLTYPAMGLFPLVRIDYIFHSADMVSLKSDVISAHYGSDHFPVRTQLAFTIN